MARITAVFDLEDRISGKLQAISNRLRSLSGMDLTPQVNIQDNTKGAISAIKSRLTTNMNATSEINVQDNTKGAISAIKGRLSTNMDATPEVNVQDNTKGIIASIRDRLSSLSGVASSIGLGGGIEKFAKSTIGAANDLEKQKISLEHFMGKGNPSMDASGVKKASESYLEGLRQNANATPFSTKEVVAGGTRALQVAKGDPKEAMKLLKIAEDMAALNPGKTLEQSMEAIADARMGEFERMKEFGLKFSKDQFDKVGWQGFMKEANGMFEGGAEKLSKSASGLWSTITGGIETSLQNAGVGALEKLKPQLEALGTWLTEGGGFKMLEEIATATVDTLVNGFLWLVATGKSMIPTFQAIWSSAQPVFNGLATGIKWVIANFDTLKPIIFGIVTAFMAFGAISKIQTAITTVKSVVTAFQAGGAAIGLLTNPIFWVVAAIGLLAAAWYGNWFGMREVVANIIAWLMPYIQQAMTFIMTVFNQVWTYIQSIMPMLQTLFTAVWGVISAVVINNLTIIWTIVQIAFQTVWNVVCVVMTTIWNYISLVWGIIAGIFKAVLQVLTGDFSGAWETMKQTALGAIENIKQLFSDFIAGAVKIGADFMTGIKDGFLQIWESIKQTAQDIWDSITGIFKDKQTVKVGVEASGSGINGSHKTGLENVPFDGYIAELHKGEMVLTASQAQLYRSGSMQFGTGETGSSIGGSGTLTPEQTATMLKTPNQATTTQNQSRSVNVNTLVGEVHIHQEADEERFIQKLKRMLEEELLTEGDGVYVG
ncbi:phage tail protein [Brevibacillus sp. SYSU BS000544]|uniref:phage tail protein n=1 Tax=Brevibacillus sp. SYSU BS000544 TaxID=3416443 RepID=UPI003CE497B7